MLPSNITGRGYGYTLARPFCEYAVTVRRNHDACYRFYCLSSAPCPLIEIDAVDFRSRVYRPIKQKLCTLCHSRTSRGVRSPLMTIAASDQRTHIGPNWKPLEFMDLVNSLRAHSKVAYCTLILLTYRSVGQKDCERMWCCTRGAQGSLQTTLDTKQSESVGT